jgi:hypothetical protein
MRFEGKQRTGVALGVLAATAAVSWATMEPGRIRSLVLILLSGFALRILLMSRSR